MSAAVPRVRQLLIVDSARTNLSERIESTNKQKGAIPVDQDLARCYGVLTLHTMSSLTVPSGSGHRSKGAQKRRRSFAWLNPFRRFRRTRCAPYQTVIKHRRAEKNDLPVSCTTRHSCVGIDSCDGTIAQFGQHLPLGKFGSPIGPQLEMWLVDKCLPVAAPFEPQFLAQRSDRLVHR